MRIEPRMIQGDELVLGKTRWLWPNRFPIGGFSLLVGNPNIGKTHFAMNMAAHITTGRKWPDCKDAPQKGAVIILTAEDSLKYSLGVRLTANGADMSQVSFIYGADIVDDNEEEKAVSIYKSHLFTELLLAGIRRQEAKGKEVRLIIIDPISSYMEGKDENRNVDVRTFIAPLAQLADENNLAIIGISHLNKDMTKLAVYRTIGSIGFSGAARAVWLVLADPENEGRKFILLVKLNEAKGAPGLAYHLTEKTISTPDGPTIAAVVEYEEKAITKTADEVFADYLVPIQTKIGIARKWLKEELTEKPLPIQSVVDNARHNRIAERTLHRAAQELGVERFALLVGNKVLMMWKLEEKKK